MSTTVEYNIITKADVNLIGTPAYYSSQDSYTQQASYNNGAADPTLVVKRLDLLVKPTPSTAPIAARVVDIDLESMKTDYIRIIHVKSDKYFLYSQGDTLVNLNAAPRELIKVAFKDFGPYISTFVPDQGHPKFIRIMNPLNINGGGSGNDVEDEPILVQVHLITQKFNV